MTLLDSNQITVATVNQRERLSDNSPARGTVVVMAMDDNTGRVRVGGPTVSTKAAEEKGIPLWPAGVTEFEDASPKDLYVAAEIAGEGVFWWIRRSSMPLTRR